MVAISAAPSSFNAKSNTIFYFLQQTFDLPLLLLLRSLPRDLAEFELGDVRQETKAYTKFLTRPITVNYASYLLVFSNALNLYLLDKRLRNMLSRIYCGSRCQRSKTEILLDLKNYVISGTLCMYFARAQNVSL